MLVSKMIKKLEAEKGFKCNHACDTCVCAKAHTNIISQIEVYAELRDVMDARKYIKKVRKLMEDADELSKCCERLSEVFFDMVNDKVSDYIIEAGLQDSFEDMKDNDYIIAYSNLEDTFIEKCTGGERYTR